MLMQELTVSTWNELNDALFADSWREELRRHRSNYAFRGVRASDHDLRSSLSRLGGRYESLERPLLRTFRRYARPELTPGDSVWNWLALGQHHGLPTRLLDWTYSPYVALHYDTEDETHLASDGAVWMIDYVQVARFLPESLQSILAQEDARVFTTEMLSRAAATLRDFDRLAAEPFVAFFEPPSFDERIVNQFALFSLMSGPAAHLDQWLDRRPGVARRVIIPAGLKWEVRDRLDQANITERVLFPGLDGLSRWLKRYYSPRPN
jgi:hypothetical protein